MHISLRAGEKIYINGAVIRVDRKVSIELMNDAVFLLESHVLPARDATTPLKQLYFIVQTMLMDPDDTAAARKLFRQAVGAMLGTYEQPDILSGLKHIDALVGADRHFEALKTIRGLLPIEAAIMAAGTSTITAKAS